MIPAKIGRYKIVRQLGEGGMGRVLLAHDPRFPRDVALKILHRDPKQDASLRERFGREARTIATLEHHAIVPVYDFGEFEGHMFLVMRLMRGGSLQDLLHGSPLPFGQTLNIVERIASALDKAHSNGVIHRDLKPANILFDEEEEAYLSDFGIVKLKESDAHLTRAGGIIGTPAYMSPEQGRALPLDGRSDIYSLGIVLYQLATGRVPFEADTPIATVVKHVREPLPPPSAINPGIDRTVEAVLLRALAKEPHERFATAGDLARALQPARHFAAATLLDQPAPQQQVVQPPPPLVSNVLGRVVSGMMPQTTRAPFLRYGLPAVGVLLLLALSVWGGGLLALWSFGNGADATPRPGRSADEVPPQQVALGGSAAGATEAAAKPTVAVTPTPTATLLVTATPTATGTPSPTSEPSPTRPMWVQAPGSTRNQIAFVSDRSGREAIYAMDLDLDVWEQLTEPLPGERHWWPAWCGPDRLVFEVGDLPFEGSGQEVWVLELGEENNAWPLTSSSRPANTASNGLPSCSPDGQTVAFSSLLRGTGSSAFRLGMLSLTNDNAPFRLVGDGYTLAGNASWSADGRSMVFMYFDPGLNNYQIYRVALADADQPLNLTSLYYGNAKYPDWSAARRQIVLACQEDSGANAVWHLCATPDDRSQVYWLLENLHRGPERDNDRQLVVHAITPSWSPDGRAIAYASDVDGDWDIYVYDVMSGDVRNLTAEWPGTEMHPTWRK